MDRARDHAEDLEEAARLERGEGIAPPSPAPRAEADLLIERPDLGPGVFTLIRAGDPIPTGLEGLPRREAPSIEPSAPAPRPRRARKPRS